MSRFLLCKSIAKTKMRYFLAPAGQPEMMRKTSCATAFARVRGTKAAHEVSLPGHREKGTK